MHLHCHAAGWKTCSKPSQKIRKVLVSFGRPAPTKRHGRDGSAMVDLKQQISSGYYPMVVMVIIQ